MRNPEKRDLNQVFTNGIPPNHRGTYWKILLGVPGKMATFPDYYKTLIESHKGQNPPCLTQIEKDVQRTFVSHLLKNENFHNTLRNVLIAYAWRNPAIGYCQSMNLIAGTLLVFMEEEESFWALCHIVEEFCTLYYTQNMTGIIVDTAVLDYYIKERLPTLSKHFQEINLSLPLLSTRWFLRLFVKNLPSETVFRIWDMLFFKGALHLFEIALALLKHFEQDLINLDDDVELVCFLDDEMKLLFSYDGILQAYAEIKPIDVHELKLRRASQLLSFTALQSKNL